MTLPGTPEQPAQGGWQPSPQPQYGPPAAPPPGYPIPPAAPKKKSSAGKTVLIVVAAVVVLCCGGVVIAAATSNNKTNNTSGAATPATTTAGAQPPATQAATTQAATTQAATTQAAPPPPSQAAAQPKQIIKVSGNGIKKTAMFTTGAEWTLVYSYDCSKFGSSGNFQVFEYDDSGAPQDVLANELDKKGNDSVPQHADAGQHYLQANSECSWTITVMG
ncbi:hypothetical protein [Dactylosporangium salmoneum]|uniref:Secreted protein n=1 Tax=Dactylosporangium salmoneum TaxID=53361 RepID=A0ABN3HCQ9_9ACTN